MTTAFRGVSLRRQRSATVGLRKASQVGIEGAPNHSMVDTIVDD